MRELNFKLYKPTELENWLTKRYKEHGILTPFDLTIKAVSEVFNTIVNYYCGPSFAEWEEGGYSMVFLNNKMSHEDQRMDFFHELCHPLRHVGIQGSMPMLFQELQEIQASQFQLVSAMPVYLLMDIQPEKYWNNYIMSIAEAFAYPPNFVECRMRHVVARIEQERRDQSIKARTTPRPAKYSYSESTKTILDQLNRQVAERNEEYHVKRQSYL